MGKKVEVTRVIDGDTFIGKSGGKEEFYRLSGVDTPKKGQRGFRPAKTALEELIVGENVSVNPVSTGYYGRAIVDVKTKDGKSVSKEMQKHAKR